MTSLRTCFLIIFLGILAGCAGPPPAAPPPANPPAQNQAALPQPTNAPAQAQEQLPPTPVPTRVVSQNPTAEADTNSQITADTNAGEAVPAEAQAETAPSTGEDHTHTVDLTHLPIGDDKVSSGPQRGYIWDCQGTFNGSGAFATGDWFDAIAGTFDFTAKPVVDGAVTWPHEFSISLNGNVRVVASNDLPDHPTGNYPVSPSDDAYNYDRNPNTISAQSLRFELPAVPSIPGQPSCVGGTIGVLLTGAMLYNAFDAGGRDAVAHEIQDGCQGHPEAQGNYHYHSVTSCVDDAGTGHSPLVGYAFDGFGLYGHRGEEGEVVTNNDLDECHGHTHLIEWDGQMVEMYHYHATWEFPYTIGCYRGTSAVDLRTLLGPPGGQAGGQPGGQGGQPGGPAEGQEGQPPQGGAPAGRPDMAAAAAQLGLTEQQLREALGPPPPDFAAAAQKLGISEEALRQALQPQ